MDYTSLLFLQFTAHLLSDFTFQPSKWCDAKDAKLFSKELLYHAIVVFGFAWVCSLSFDFWWAALVVALVHLGLDIVKSYFIRKNVLKKYLFFIDQALHFAFIVFIVVLYLSLSFGTLRVTALNPFFIVFALVACTKPANIFIKKFMEVSGVISKKEEDDALINAGRVIGSLERILSFILILCHQWAVVGFIIAAKSILRFRDTDTAKTEYLLIGSLLSFGIAILFGVAYQYKLYELIT
jgi:hypothetical protein